MAVVVAVETAVLVSFVMLVSVAVFMSVMLMSFAMLVSFAVFVSAMLVSAVLVSLVVIVSFAVLVVCVFGLSIGPALFGMHLCSSNSFAQICKCEHFRAYVCMPESRYRCSGEILMTA